MKLIEVLPQGKNLSQLRRGFILPFTMLLVAIILLVVGTGSKILSKQLYFSKVYKQSQTAYYAADDAINCAIVVDDTFVGIDGYGIFPGGTTDEPDDYIDSVITNINDQRLLDGLATISRDDIKCAQVPIFDTSESDFAVSATNYEYSGPSGLETGKTSVFDMTMPVGDGTFRCAKVTVNKTPSFRQIIAQGYALCNSAVGSVERAVVNTTIIEGADQELSSRARTILGHIESLQYQNGTYNSFGAIRLASSPSVYVTGTAYYNVNPYFAHIAVIQALLSDDEKGVEIAEKWITWYLNHVDPVKYTVYDRWYSLSGATETSCASVIGSGSCPLEDATDSNIALFFVVLDQYVKSGGDPAIISGNQTTINNLKNTLVALIDTDGLTWAKDTYPVKYLMDNVEVWAGLKAASNIYGNVFNNASTSSTLNAQASANYTAVQTILYNPTDKKFAIHKNEIGNVTQANLSTWYPDAVAQIWPALFYSLYGNVSYGSPARLAWATFDTTINDWEQTLRGSPWPWVSVGLSSFYGGYASKGLLFNSYLLSQFPTIETSIPSYVNVNDLGWWLSLENRSE